MRKYARAGLNSLRFRPLGGAGFHGVAVAVFGLLGPAAVAQPPAAFEPFFERHCYTCHDPDMEEGGLDLMSLSADLSDPRTMRVWTRVHDRVQNGEMPPEKKPRPGEGEKAKFLGMLAKGLTNAHQQHKGTVLRRLNRVEYETTMNDMLGIREELAEFLPEDGTAHGFDNVGEALDLSSVHLERYMDAARRAIDAAIRRGPMPESSQSTHSLADGDGEDRIGKHWHQADDGAVVLFNNGFPRAEVDGFRTDAEGKYRVKITGYAYQSDAPVAFELWQGNFNRGGHTEKVGTYAFAPGEPRTREVEIWMKEHAKFLIQPQLDVDRSALREKGPSGYPGKGLAIASIEVEGPIYDAWPGRGHELLFGDVPMKKNDSGGRGQPDFVFDPDNPEADARDLLREFLPVAFRRPVNDSEMLPILDLIEAELDGGADFEQAMRTGYLAALCSPDFLYLREPAGRLDDFALASRLSYTFWKTSPDEELRQLARDKRLSDPAVLRAQVDRLIDDPRSERFVKNFVDQWLNLREIDFTTPDSKLYPEFDAALRDAMLAETRGFFSEVFHDNLSVLNFIDSDWTMVNERLARHYGIEGVVGPEMQKVSLKPEHRRGGVMTHASVLKVSANGTTTSPVIRGVFVLERILGIEPSPPPPNIPGVEPDIRGATTIREQLAQHRDVESCRSCHKLIDPPGFALESYDVMGGFRENYRSLNKDFPEPPEKLRGGQNRVPWRVGPEVDATGVTVDGKPFSDLDEFKGHLLEDSEKLVHAMAEKFAVYSTGRPMGFSDRPTLDYLAHEVVENDYGYRDLIHAVVQSEIFRHK